MAALDLMIWSMVLGAHAAVGVARTAGLVTRPSRSQALGVVYHLVIFVFVLLLSGVLGAAWPGLDRGVLHVLQVLAGPLSAGLPGVWRFAGATNFSSSLDVAFTHIVTLAVGAVMGPAPAALWRIGRQVADGLAKPARLLILPVVS